MISKATSQGLEERKLEYILGVRMRRQREVCNVVLARAGRYQEVWHEGRRYVACHNPEEAAKDAADREAIVQALQLVGNQGYWRFLRVERDAVAIDPKKVAAEARYDGKFVLRTNTTPRRRR